MHGKFAIQTRMSALKLTRTACKKGPRKKMLGPRRWGLMAGNTESWCREVDWSQCPLVEANPRVQSGVPVWRGHAGTGPSDCRQLRLWPERGGNLRTIRAAAGVFRRFWLTPCQGQSNGGPLRRSKRKPWVTEPAVRNAMRLAHPPLQFFIFR